MVSPGQVILAQINPLVGDMEGNLEKIRNVRDNASPETSLIVFPELSVCGYPPEDRLLSAGFPEQAEKAVETLAQESRDRNPVLALGAPWRQEGRLYNALHIVGGGEIRATVCKRHLPNYGVFDEHRWFTSGPLPEPVEIHGKSCGFTICEDMWHEETAAHLKKRGAEVLIAANASPYETGKSRMRLAAACARVAETGLPLLYVNQIGGQDDLVFDGGSFALDAHGNLAAQALFFEEDFLSLSGHNDRVEHPDEELETIYKALCLGLRDYVVKNGFPGVLIGLSGGVDSALCAALAADALGPDRVRCVMMPSPFTAPESLRDARECARLLGVSYEEIPISAAMKIFEDTVRGLSGTAHENMQARVRGLILMSLSNMTGLMVLSTGNKSEYATGYATLYGDMCGGFAPLKDVYKTRVYDLVRRRNAQSRVVPENILIRPPTAELKPGQTDQDTLPPYPVLDSILECLVEHGMTVEKTAEGRHDRHMVERIARMLKNSEYKRRQSPLGPKITERAFGRERRYPVTGM